MPALGDKLRGGLARTVTGIAGTAHGGCWRVSFGDYDEEYT